MDQEEVKYTEDGRQVDFSNIYVNQDNTPLEDLKLNTYPIEVQEQFMDFICNVPYIKECISINKPRACDLPRDEQGRIIVRIGQVHHLENMDYFRQTAIHYQKTGKLTDYRVNSNPNSDYGRWFKEEIRRCWEGMVRPEDGEWITGDMYFFLNYCPIMQSKTKVGSKKALRVWDFPEVWEGHYYKFHYIEQARNSGLHGAELASRGKGKAHPYSQKVYTPDGLKTWGEIQIGSQLIGDDGEITTVIDIPFDDVCDVYKITLKDGREVYASENHLWKVIKRHSKQNSVRICSTKQIQDNLFYNRRVNYRNPNGREYIYGIIGNSGVNCWKEKEVSISPYTMGLIIGDGCFRNKDLANNVYFTSSYEDMITYESIVPYNIKYLKTDKEFFINIPNVKYKLQEYGLHMLKSEDKFIPDDYKFNSRRVRLDILKGLMDSDGTVTNGIPVLSTASKRLADDVAFIARSLGYNCVIRTKRNRGYRKNNQFIKCLDAYEVRIFTNDKIFNLKRKYEKLTDFSSKYSRSNKESTTIVDIQFSHRERCKCVTVDNESNCYLVGDFVTTHNSYSLAALLAKRFILGENKETTKEVKCLVTAYQKEYLNRDGVLNKFQSYIDFCSDNTQFPNKKLKNSLNDMNWTMGYFDLDTQTRKGTLNEVLGVSSKDDDSKLRGKRAALIGIEEFGSFPNLLGLYGTLRPGMEEGDYAFGLIWLQGCVCAGTKVQLPNGQPINIEDVNKGDKLLGYNCNKSSVENISWLQPYAEKECVRICTEKNNYIECSIDHPILAINKNKYNKHLGTCSFYRANELNIGDTLLMPRKVGRFGKVHEDNAYLLGNLFGDGSYSDNSCVTMSITTEEEYEYWNSKYDINISKLKDGYAQIYFRKIHSLLKKYKMDKQSFENKKLPYNIFDWDKESLCNFLGGYFNADGNVQIVKQKHRSIKLTCKYENILIQIKYLLLKLGISAHIYKEHKKGRVLKSNVNNRSYIMRENDVYVLYISNSIDIQIFKQNIRFIIKSKQDRLDSYTYEFKHGIVDKIKFKLRDNGKGKNFDGKYFYDLQEVSIKSIEYLGVKRIYNMTADTTHTYISNGFISSNTAGDKSSDFHAAETLMYQPIGYHLYPVQNVYDKIGQGRKHFVYFFPGFINRKGCYDHDGNSDVTKAILEILVERYIIKHNATDVNAISKAISEIPITPQEAIIKAEGCLFPIAQLTERLNQIDGNPSEYDDVYVGSLVQNSNGEVEYLPTNETPIHIFPTKDNKLSGAIEIFQMPQKNRDGKVQPNRYIIGYDPVAADQADTMSLASVFVLDLFTDQLVAEYTGRQIYEDQNHEIVRLMCLFYNAKCMYENNIKGCYAYFAKMNCLHLLADTPEYLRDKQLVKTVGWGNTSKGIRASKPINGFGDQLIKDWLLKPVPKVIKDEDGNDKEIAVPNLYLIRNRALLEELIQYNPYINVDRIRALSSLMLYREEKIIIYQGKMKQDEDDYDASYLGNDDFFTRNYNKKQSFLKY